MVPFLKAEHTVSGVPSPLIWIELSLERYETTNVFA